jgi:hypothetical protein
MASSIYFWVYQEIPPWKKKKNVNIRNIFTIILKKRVYRGG